MRLNMIVSSKILRWNNYVTRVLNIYISYLYGCRYWWGYGQGKTAGAFMATEAMMNWVKEKAGVFQFDQWMRESEEEDETLL